jgi:ATP-dependent Lon protease
MIVEYLAVQAADLRLIVHAVGKTSLGKSIARATGRDFVRFSLGAGRPDQAQDGAGQLVGALSGQDHPVDAQG